ncbi:MAG TPA: adenylate/guanylate cyclase domain-containing protein, partial [Chthonomonadaceae bacterium]|nr:adenylate/guanylate cyclase domain-containing protein [Chthonomonadaceae bacterium]
MPALPTDMVTFLFTDIEGSTRLWEQFPEAMRESLTRHDALLSAAITRWNGFVFNTMGDGFCAAFAEAGNALAAALDIQRALHAEVWGATGPLRVRIALHTGPAEPHDGDYFGPTTNRADRLLDAGYGGQVLLSEAMQEQVRAALPSGVTLCDLGEHRLKDLVRHERIFQVVAPDLPAEFPPLRSLDIQPNNLPAQPSSFIGRESEMAEVRRLLTGSSASGNRQSDRAAGHSLPANGGGTRLLTLTGPGGCGKTRLALQAAADLLGAYPDGVWLVEFAEIADPDRVPQAVAQALGVREEPGRSSVSALTDFLYPRRLLLLFDTCEPLIAACAALANALLLSCPKLQILATSREALGIAGETAWRVPPLPIPDAQTVPTVENVQTSLAVQLFVERAKAAQPDFALTSENAPAVAQLCSRLDGLPLALELAAAQVGTLLVESLTARPEESILFLPGDAPIATPRQQTLAATLDWSYHLLSEPERILLRRLAVFAGG